VARLPHQRGDFRSAAELLASIPLPMRSVFRHGSKSLTVRQFEGKLQRVGHDNVLAAAGN
jgi:hypothetical protein